MLFHVVVTHSVHLLVTVPFEKEWERLPYLVSLTPVVQGLFDTSVLTVCSRMWLVWESAEPVPS